MRASAIKSQRDRYPMRLRPSSSLGTDRLPKRLSKINNVYQIFGFLYQSNLVQLSKLFTITMVFVTWKVSLLRNELSE